MLRSDALVMQRIYEIQKHFGRNLYLGDLVAEQVLPAGKCKSQLTHLRDNGFVKELADHGANTYAVTVKGYQQMCAYRDVKRCVEAVA